MKFGFVTRVLAFLAGFIIVSPLVALLFKVHWSDFFSGLHNTSPITLSLWSSTVATFFALLLGVPLAWIFARGSKKITSFVRPLILAPIVLPPTVTGIALLALMGRTGILGKPIYEATGWSMPFTSSAVVLTGIFVGLPFVVLVCESNFRQLPKEIEDAAVIDQVTGRQLLQRIAIPQSRSAIITSGLLAWARAIGEFGATLMFAGSFPGTTQTWPMFIYQELDIDPHSAFSYAFLMLLVAIFVVFLLRNQLREAFH